MEYMTDAMVKFKERATNLVDINDSSKLILYSNSHSRNEQNHEAVVTWLNESRFHGDLILITSNFMKEEKFYQSMEMI
jgi:hypothetical protein